MIHFFEDEPEAEEGDEVPADTSMTDDEEPSKGDT